MTAKQREKLEAAASASGGVLETTFKPHGIHTRVAWELVPKGDTDLCAICGQDFQHGYGRVKIRRNAVWSHLACNAGADYDDLAKAFAVHAAPRLGVADLKKGVAGGRALRLPSVKELNDALSHPQLNFWPDDLGSAEEDAEKAAKLSPEYRSQKSLNTRAKLREITVPLPDAERPVPPKPTEPTVTKEAPVAEPSPVKVSIYGPALKDADRPGFSHAMRGPDGRLDLTVSKSWLAQMDQCPEMARTDLMREYRRRTNAASELGSAFHVIAERALIEMAISGETILRTPTLVDCLSLGVESFEWGTNGPLSLPHKSVTSIDHASSLLAKITEIWYRRIVPLLNPETDAWKIEETGSAVLVDNERWTLRIHGTPDLWDGKRIWDWKTGMVLDWWKADRLDDQMTCYAAILGLERAEGVLAYIPREQLAKWSDEMILRVHRGPEHLADLIGRVEAIAELVDAELPVWPKRAADWACSPRWCSVFASGGCRGAHLDYHSEARMDLRS